MEIISTVLYRPFLQAAQGPLRELPTAEPALDGVDRGRRPEVDQPHQPEWTEVEVHPVYHASPQLQSA